MAFPAGLSSSRPPEQDMWEYTPTVFFPDGGLVTQGAPFDIEDIDWQDSENFVVRNRRPIVDTGYAAFAVDPWTSVQQIVEGRPRKSPEHVALDGTRESLLITNLMGYILANGPSSTKYWKPLPSSTSTTLNGAASGTSATLTSAVGFAIGNYIGLTDNNGYVFLAKISNLVGVAVTLDRSLPGSGTFGNGNVVYKCINGGLAGTDDHQVDWILHPIKRWVIFTNNIDVVMKWTGTVGDVLGGLSAISLTRARCLGYFNGLVHLGDVTVSGVRLLSGMYWSDTDPEIYTTGGGSIAGNTRLSDVNDGIVAIKNLLKSNIIYLEKSIARQSLVGNVVKLFSFETLIGSGSLSQAYGIGCVATNAVYAFPDYHIFLASDGLRLYQGAQNTELITKDIFQSFFDINGRIDRGKISRSFIFHVEGNNELYAVFAEVDDDFPRTAVIVSLDTGRVFKRRFSHELTFGDVRRGTINTTINDLVGTIAEQNWSMDSSSLTGSLAVILLGKAAANVTYVYDLITPQEDGASIPWYVKTKEFRSEGFFRRYDRHIFLIAGTDVDIEVSKDRGISWDLLGAYAPGSAAMLEEALPDQFVTDNVTYRVSGIGGGVELYRLAAYSKPESQWEI